MSSVTLDYLAKLLVARVRVTGVELLGFVRGFRMPENYVVAPKLILVLEGAVEYELEGTILRLSKGNIFFRHGWSRSS
jgi:hypothetical protein